MLSKIETIAGIISRNVHQRLGLCTSTVNLHKAQWQLQILDHSVVTRMRKLAKTNCTEECISSAKLLKKYVLCECGSVMQEQNLKQHLIHGDACTAEEAKHYIKEEIVAEKNSPLVKGLRGKLKRYVLCECGYLVHRRGFVNHLFHSHNAGYLNDEIIEESIEEEFVAEKDSPRVQELRKGMRRRHEEWLEERCLDGMRRETIFDYPDYS